MNLLKTVLIVINLLIFSNVNAQFILPKESLADDFMGRKLLVQLREHSEERLHKFRKDPDVAKAYEEYIKTQNEIFKSTITKYCELNAEIQFLSAEQIDEHLSQNDPSDYSILIAEYGIAQMIVGRNVTEIPGFKFYLHLADKKRPVFEVMVPTEDLNDNDHKFLILTINKHMKAAADGLEMKDIWNTEEKLAILAKKTLLISNQQSDLSESEAQGMTDLKIQFVEPAELEQRITDGEDILFSTLFMQMHRKLWVHTIVDASTMEIINMVPAEGFELSLAVPLFESGSTRNFVTIPLYRSSLQLTKKFFKYAANEKSVNFNYK